MSAAAQFGRLDLLLSFAGVYELSKSIMEETKERATKQASSRWLSLIRTLGHR